MDGLGISFARSWAARKRASRPELRSQSQSQPQPPQSKPQSQSKPHSQLQQTPAPQPASSPPLLGLPQGPNLRPRSSTQSSGDSFMEKRLSEFNDWKQKLTKEHSRKKSITLIPEETLSGDVPHCVKNDQTDPVQQSPPQQSPRQQSPPEQLQAEHPQAQQTPTKESPSTQPHTRNSKCSKAIRDKARLLAFRARDLPDPDLNLHPAFRPQHIRLRKKENEIKTDVPKCWRPLSDTHDDLLRECCNMGRICEDCGFVLCKTCGSRCKGEDFCVVQGCVRCQTRLGINTCTSHLRELRVNPTERFHGHLVENGALSLVERL